MKTYRVMDFSLLPEVKSGRLFIRLSSTIEKDLLARSYLQEFHERAKSAVMFFGQMDAKNEPWQNEARVRAGLNEFYSLEDAVRRGFRISKQVCSPPKLADSPHPLIHVMYSLRHINVHVKPSPTLNKDVNLVLHGPAGGKLDFTIPAVMLDSSVKQPLLQDRDVRKFYKKIEIDRALDWVLENQKIFGISEIFHRGVEAYCFEVLDA